MYYESTPNLNLPGFMSALGMLIESCVTNSESYSLTSENEIDVASTHIYSAPSLVVTDVFKVVVKIPI